MARRAGPDFVGGGRGAGRRARVEFEKKRNLYELSHGVLFHYSYCYQEAGALWALAST